VEDYTEEQISEMRAAKLASFASSIVKKRAEAKAGRAKSGIERVWREDELYYAGIDDANNEEGALKPATKDGVVTMKAGRGDAGNNRSTVFVNITQPYVDSGAARVSEMLLPTNDKPVSIKPTPIPEIGEDKESDELMPDGQTSVADAAKAFIVEMEQKAEKAETQIWDWLVESRWHSEMRKVIEQCALLGVGVIKGPFPVKRKRRKMNQSDGVIELVITDEMKPASRAIDVWNLYPDPSCGNNIHNGNYIFERDLITKKELSDLKGTGYIDDQIDAVIKEGPSKKYIDNPGSEETCTESYEIWYYHGYASAEEMNAAGHEAIDHDQVPVILVMINDRIIKASLSIMDSGEFPYDVMSWKKRTDHWAGVGIARQVRTAQRMVLAATRNMMDNAGISAGPQIFMKRNSILPADGVWEISPLKIWWVDEDVTEGEAHSAITTVQIPMIQAELEAIIRLAMEFAERSTSMPMLLQGDQGSATHTVGGMTILQNNSMSVLRAIAKTFDDDVVEPHVTRYYEWLMIYGENDDMKGDFSITPQGSAAFYERDSQNQAIMQLIPMAATPGYGLNPEKLMVELLKMNKISPERVSFTKEEKEQQAQATQGQGEPSALDVAKLKVDGDLQKAQLVQQSDKEELELKGDAMRAEFALKLQMQQEQFEHELRIEQLRLQIKMMELSSQQNISLESIKASLADSALKLQTQKELSRDSLKTTQVSMPETEPVGQAPDGQAYQR